MSKLYLNKTRNHSDFLLEKKNVYMASINIVICLVNYWDGVFHGDVPGDEEGAKCTFLHQIYSLPFNINILKPQ